jgi:hypothetical protein
VVSFTPFPLYLQGKIALYTLDKRFTEPEIRFGLNEEKKILDHTGTLTPNPPLSSP